MPVQFENGRNLTVETFLQDLDAKEMYLHLKNRSVAFQESKIFCFHHLQVFTDYRFQNVLIRVPFSKSTVFKMCRQKMCRFRVNGRPIRHIFHRFQNVPASCEHSLNLMLHHAIFQILKFARHQYLVSIHHFLLRIVRDDSFLNLIS